jgi:hypothetical protein
MNSYLDCIVVAALEQAGDFAPLGAIPGMVVDEDELRMHSTALKPCCQQHADSLPLTSSECDQLPRLLCSPVWLSHLRCRQMCCITCQACCLCSWQLQLQRDDPGVKKQDSPLSALLPRPAGTYAQPKLVAKPLGAAVFGGPS